MTIISGNDLPITAVECGRLKVIIGIDIQHDFTTGALANPDAARIIHDQAEYIRNSDADIVFLTQDTHSSDYLETKEGTLLPVPHCIEDTWGWEIEEEIKEACEGKTVILIEKPSFGYNNWKRYGKYLKSSDIYVFGEDTDICVVSNVLALKAEYPEEDIHVIERLCAGLTPEKHKAAIEVMKSCQVDII